MTSLFYYSYYGCKRLDYKFYSQYLPDLTNITTIIEPFCGSCFNSLKYYTDGHKDKLYIMVDNDDKFIGFLQYIKKYGSNQLIKEYNNALPLYSGKDCKVNYDKFITKYKMMKDEDQYKYYLVFNRCRGIREGLAPTTKKFKQIENDYFKETDEFFKHAQIICCDYLDIIKKYMHDEKAFIFLDPPYFSSFNTNYKAYGKNEEKDDESNIIDNTKMYIELLDIFKTSKAKLMMIINSNAITNFIYKDYIKSRYNKLYQITKKKTEHLIIRNF